MLADQLATVPEAQREITKIGELIREGARQARMLSRGLSPVSLEAEGLMAALKELTESSGDLFGNSCRFQCTKPVAVRDNVVATHLYRIAQEAVSNAARHGRAKSIVVALERTNERYPIEHQRRWFGISCFPEPSGRHGFTHHAVSRGIDRSNAHDRRW